MRDLNALFYPFALRSSYSLFLGGAAQKRNIWLLILTLRQVRFGLAMKTVFEASVS